ncbi:MAG: thioesterase domain-containing protein, partial [Pseudonocardia sp.]|nr:thioesterase domain-containing protein [Pseudonocardia sp.]
RARYRPGGVVEFLGRHDHQVKVGGYPIALGEIESTLLSAPGVEAAVALVDASGGLAAYVTGTARLDVGGLRELVVERLPAYMVPTGIAQLDALPLSDNGKVDRGALRQLTTARGDVAERAHAVAPDSATEQRLLQVWRTLLGPSVGGVTDDFFACGGHSLLAVGLFRQIESVFGRRLPLASLFRDSTVRAQAALLADAAAGACALVPIVPGRTDGPHLVLVHPVGGDILCYRDVVNALSGRINDVAVSGLRTVEPPPASVDAMADRYAQAVIAELPDQPVHLAGWSMGGTVALHTAVHLERAGHLVGSVTAVDAFSGHGADVEPSVEAERESFLTDLAATGSAFDAVPDERLFEVYRSNAQVLRRHRPVGWRPAKCVFVRASRTPADYFPGLRPLDEQLGLPAVSLDEDHYSVVRGRSAARLADQLAKLINSDTAQETKA